MRIWILSSALLFLLFCNSVAVAETPVGFDLEKYHVVTRSASLYEIDSPFGTHWTLSLRKQDGCLLVIEDHTRLSGERKVREMSVAETPSHANLEQWATPERVREELSRTLGDDEAEQLVANMDACELGYRLLLEEQISAHPDWQEPVGYDRDAYYFLNNQHKRPTRDGPRAGWDLVVRKQDHCLLVISARTSNAEHGRKRKVVEGEVGAFNHFERPDADTLRTYLEPYFTEDPQGLEEVVENHERCPLGYRVLINEQD